MFLQCWYCEGRVSRTTCWLVLLQLHLEVQTQQVGQKNASALTICSTLFHLNGHVKKTHFSWFQTIMSPTCQYQSSKWQKKKTFSGSHCRPQTSHKLQPLDCTVFGLYKWCYNAYRSDWTLSNQRKIIAIHSVAVTIWKSFSKAFSLHNIEKGFHVTGIYTLNGTFCEANSCPPMSLTDLTVR